MSRKTNACLALLAIATAMEPSFTNAAQDTALSLVINPRTGAASIRNDTSAAVSIDGYLLTSSQSVFNPAAWQTLTANPSYSGWAQGPAAANRLGEANLLSSTAVSGGATIGVGSPYIPFSPTQIGQAEPALKFEYSIDGIGSIVGDVVFAPQNTIVLLVNPATGQASLQNQSNFPVNIDGLLIKSPTHALDPIGWNGFAENGTSGWTKGAAETNRLGEGNLLGSTLLSANGAPLNIGLAANPAALHDETDLQFEYHITGGGSLAGGVAFVTSTLSPAVQGDYNGNGIVDAADYVVWRKNLGGGTLPNRGNGITGPVGQTDYSFWKSRFGDASGTGSAEVIADGVNARAVPEPESWLLLILAGSLFVTLFTGSTSKVGLPKATENLQI